MPVNGTVKIDGLSHEQADAGVPFNAMPLISGEYGAPVTDVSVIWGGDGLPPLDPMIGIQGFPCTSGGASATGTDSNGSIAVVCTYAVQPTEDSIFDTTVCGVVDMEDGFWQQEARVFIDDVTGTRRIQASFVALDVNDPNDFPGNTPPNDPTNLVASDISYDEDEEEGGATLTWTDNGGNPKGTIIIRDDKGVGSVPPGDTSFRDIYRGPPGTKHYKVKTYGPNGPSLSGPSNDEPVVYGGGSPDINITGSGGIALGGTATFLFIGDPSGIYTLVEGKTHDTLYDRTGEESVDVAIPNPFIETGYIPEEE